MHLAGSLKRRAVAAYIGFYLTCQVRSASFANNTLFIHAASFTFNKLSFKSALEICMFKRIAFALYLALFLNMQHIAIKSEKNKSTTPTEFKFLTVLLEIWDQANLTKHTHEGASWTWSYVLLKKVFLMRELAANPQRMLPETFFPPLPRLPQPTRFIHLQRNNDEISR